MNREKKKTIGSGYLLIVVLAVVQFALAYWTVSVFQAADTGRFVTGVVLSIIVLICRAGYFMVHLALDELVTKNVVDLDEERKAAMVSNLLVILCGDENAQPVLNTGSLHT